MSNLSRASRLLLLALTFIATCAFAATTQYFYDNLGRLSTVINSDGSVIEYSYDANGSMTSINRIASTALSITLLSPSASYVGSSISIYGTGFSTTANQNLVTIGGAAATVTAATNNSLTVTVPSAANTGPISVTANGSTVSSSQNFVVQRVGISSVTPLLANPGTAITLAGANLNLVPGSSSLSVGSQPVTPSSLSNTQATFAAPNASGFVSVNTPYGIATSASPLIVLPSTISVANATSVAAITAGGASQTINVSQANKYGVFHFSGTQGQVLSLQLSSFTVSPSTAPVTVQVYSPTNTLLLTTTVNWYRKSVHLPVLPATGSYIVAFNSSTATYQLTASLEINATVAVDGAPASLSTNGPSQTKRFNFVANAGDKVGLGISNIVKTNGAGVYLYVDVFRPDSSALASGVECSTTNGCEINLDINVSGSYTIHIYSANASGEPWLTFSFTATLSNNLIVAAPLDTATPISITRNGQNAYATFAGTAGAAVSVQVGGIVTAPYGRYVYLTVQRPDGSALQSTTASVDSGNAATFILNNLPTTGTYKVFIDPRYGVTANLSVRIVTSAANGLTLDGASSSLNSAGVPGAGGIAIFSATAGSKLGLGISNIVKTNGTAGYTQMRLYVYRPDGAVLFTGPDCVFANGCEANLSIPTTGMYTAQLVTTVPSVEPNMTMSFTATLSTDLVVPATAGSPSSVSLTRQGQNGRVTFAATAGAPMTVQIGGVSTTPAGRSVVVTIFRPDNVQYSTTTVNSASGNGLVFVLSNPPQTGTYTVFIDPQYGALANVVVQPQTLSNMNVPVNGAPSSINTASTPGAGGLFSFTATAGDQLGLGISNIVKTNGSAGVTTMSVYVYRPDGSALVNGATCIIANGCDLNLSIATTGTYLVQMLSASPSVEPNMTMSFTATLSTDLVVPATVGSPSSVSLTRQGQNGRVTFAATAGAPMTVQIGGVSTTPAGRSVVVTIFRPDNVQYSTTTVNSASGNGLVFVLHNPPQTGTYTVFIDPQYGAFANVVVQPQAWSNMNLAVNGASSSINTTATPGAGGLFSFTATAGDQLGLGISNIVKTNGNAGVTTMSVYVYRPDGSALVNGATCIIANGCDLNLSIATTGTYLVQMLSASPSTEPNMTMSFTATLSSELVVAAPASTATPVSIARQGQNARVTFSGTTGTSIALQIGSIATTPAGRTLTLTVRRPDSTVLTSTSTVSGTTINLTNLPQTGTYSLTVDPQYGATANFTVTLP